MTMADKNITLQDETAERNYQEVINEKAEKLLNDIKLDDAAILIEMNTGHNSPYAILHSGMYPMRLNQMLKKDDPDYNEIKSALDELIDVKMAAIRLQKEVSKHSHQLEDVMFSPWQTNSVLREIIQKHQDLDAKTALKKIMAEFILKEEDDDEPDSLTERQKSLKRYVENVLHFEHAKKMRKAS